MLSRLMGGLTTKGCSVVQRNCSTTAMTMAKWTATAGVAGAGWFFALLYLAQRTLIFPGKMSPAAAPEVGKLIKTKDGSVGLYFPPVPPQQKVLFYCHGNGDQLGWGPAFLGEDINRSSGVGFFAMEYPGFGVAEGSPSETANDKVADSLITHLKDELKVRNEDIVLFGQSIGCVPALTLAAKGVGGKAVLVSPFTSMRSMALTAYPFLRAVSWLLPWMILDPCDNEKSAEAVKIPTLVIHGDQDEIVPFDHGKKVAARLERADFVAVAGAGHNDILEGEEPLGTLLRFTLA